MFGHTPSIQPETCFVKYITPTRQVVVPFEFFGRLAVQHRPDCEKPNNDNRQDRGPTVRLTLPDEVTVDTSPDHESADYDCPLEVLRGHDTLRVCQSAFV